MTRVERFVTAPASKSVSHRAIIAASLAIGRSSLSGVLESDDTERTIEAMRACGAHIEREAPGKYMIMGMSGTPAGGGVEPARIDVGESGTTCRLVTAVVAGGLGDFHISGRGRMHERPIGELGRALESLNASVIYEDKQGYPPLLVRAHTLPGGAVSISLEESSQYLSGLLLAAPMGRTLTIEITGEKAVSWPYVGLTLQVLEDFGVDFEVQNLINGHWTSANWREMREARPGATRFIVQPANFTARDYEVEGDWSNASYFLLAGAIGPNAVTVSGLRRDSLQGDVAILSILARMGAELSWTRDAVTVSQPAGGLRGVEVDMGQCPDLAPGVAVAAAMANGPTRITGAAHLRLKESDRLDAPAQELIKAGCHVEVTDDGLYIEPRPLTQGEVALSSHDDHRIAMSLTLLELAGVAPRLDNVDCVAKSFPSFFRVWETVKP